MGGVESKCEFISGDGGGIRNISNGGVTCGVPTSAAAGGSLNKPKLPMPDHAEVESRFAKILVSLG